MNSQIQFPAIVDGVNSKKDRTLTIKLGTPELSSDETAEIFSMANDQVWVAMAPQEVTRLDIPDEVVDLQSGQISSSERLRKRMFVYYQEKFGKAEGFEYWRQTTLDNWGKKLLDKLEK